MDLNTIMYGGLTKTQLTFFVLVMLVISHISVLLHKLCCPAESQRINVDSG